MGAAQTKSNSIKINQPTAAAGPNESGTIKSGPIPELRIKAESWTRESHGLYDFEGTEIETKTYKLKGSQRFSRNESQVTVQAAHSDNFEECEAQLSLSERDRVVARFLYRNNSYWMYHKQLIDENIDQVLERKPEEKIWQVVRSTYQPQVDFPCYRIRRRDLIKVGRVRFKVRDIMSPVYRNIQDQDDFFSEKHHMLYPSFDESSIVDESSMANSHALLSQQEEEEGAEGLAEDAMSLNESQEEGAGNESATESDENDVLSQPLRPGTLANIQFNQVLPGIEDDLGFDPESSARGNYMPQTGRHTDRQKRIRRRTTNATMKSKKKTPPKKVEPEPLMQSTKSLPDVPVCRICLMEDNDTDNPLITPCKCLGSMGYIHHACLKTWFHQKRVMKQGPVVTTYFWKNLECELCKQPYPYETRSLDGKQWLNIIEYETPPTRSDGENYYIVLESISSNTSKVIHVINMEKTIKLYIGRGHDAHVRVTDISVSRIHAMVIRSTQGYYFLTDNESKFGTLALVKTPMEIKPKQQVQLQVGRTLFTIDVKNSLQAMIKSCCCISAQKAPKRDSSQLISLNGVDYFPIEFASKQFCQIMTRRKRTSLKRLASKMKSHSLPMDTRQDQSDLAHVDQFIDQIAVQRASSRILNELPRSRQVSHVLSDQVEEDRDRSNISVILAQREGEEVLSPVFIQQPSAQEEQLAELSGEDHNPDLVSSLSESDSDGELQRADQQALENAIQQSLIQQANESRNPMINSYHGTERDVIEEAKEFMPEIDCEENEESKMCAIDTKNGPSPQQIQDENSVLSTARVSQHGAVEFRSTLVLNNRGYDSEYQLNSDRVMEPSSVVITKNKALDLSRDASGSAQTPSKPSSYQGEVQGKLTTHRQGQVINEVIREEEEIKIDDDRFQTIDQQISGQYTEINPMQSFNARLSPSNDSDEAEQDGENKGGQHQVDQ